MDDVFTLLSDTHRRRLLVALLDHDPGTDEPIVVPEDLHVGDRDVRNLHLEMVHKHLPKLAAVGVIRWDRETREVRAGPRFEEIRPLLELLNDNAGDVPGEWV